MLNAHRIIAALAVCVGLSEVGTAQADNRDFAESLGTTAIKLAHPTGKDVGMLKYNLEQTSDRVTVTVKMEYFGAFTGRQYVADVEFEFVTAGRPALLEIRYSDNNVIPGSSGWKDRMRRSINRTLASKD